MHFKMVAELHASLMTSRAITIGVYPAESCDYVASLHYVTTETAFCVFNFCSVFLLKANKNLQQDHSRSIYNALMMITGAIETFAICQLYRFALSVIFIIRPKYALGCSSLISMVTGCGIICADDFINPVKYSKHMIHFLMAKNKTCPMGAEARTHRFPIRCCFYSILTFFLSEHARKQWKRHTPMLG